MPWDLFCRVVDNFGDIGVCWRLAAQLAEQGRAVRLWVDDALALSWMAPNREVTHPLVEVRRWDEAGAPDGPVPGEVVIEAFGCDPPAAFVERMAQRHRHTGRQPFWINLEYLTAEPFAERNHRLPSPQQHGPGAGLTKHFFFPGFSDASGGLLREMDLADRLRRFDAAAWLQRLGVTRRPGERLFSLFCYPQAPVAGLIDAWLARGGTPLALLATAGAAGEALGAVLGPTLQRGPVRGIRLPWLSQQDFDHLLWSCDINWVRGEDSAVRAQWAGRPFVWQLYPQADGADRPKAEAFLGRLFDARRPQAAPPETVAAVHDLWQHWNGWATGGTDPWRALDDAGAWQARCLAWREYLWSQRDLVDRLNAFIAEAS